jgi:hypothetical protein
VHRVPFGDICISGLWKRHQVATRLVRSWFLLSDLSSTTTNHSRRPILETCNHSISAKPRGKLSIWHLTWILQANFFHRRTLPWMISCGGENDILRTVSEDRHLWTLLPVCQTILRGQFSLRARSLQWSLLWNHARSKF